MRGINRRIGIGIGKHQGGKEGVSRRFERVDGWTRDARTTRPLVAVIIRVHSQKPNGGGICQGSRTSRGSIGRKAYPYWHQERARWMPNGKVVNPLQYHDQASAIHAYLVSRGVDPYAPPPVMPLVKPVSSALLPEQQRSQILPVHPAYRRPSISLIPHL